MNLLYFSIQYYPAGYLYLQQNIVFYFNESVIVQVLRIMIKSNVEKVALIRISTCERLETIAYK